MQGHTGLRDLVSPPTWIDFLLSDAENSPSANQLSHKRLVFLVDLCSTWHSNVKISAEEKDAKGDHGYRNASMKGNIQLLWMITSSTFSPLFELPKTS